jgi:hypothetical protein
MHKTLPSTQRYLTHYLSHTHITHWDLAFSLPEGLVAYFAIFVNAEFYIEASVANGNNLTFTYVTAINNNLKIFMT